MARSNTTFGTCKPSEISASSRSFLARDCARSAFASRSMRRNGSGVGVDLSVTETFEFSCGAISSAYHASKSAIGLPNLGMLLWRLRHCLTASILMPNRSAISRYDGLVSDNQEYAPSDCNRIDINKLRQPPSPCWMPQLVHGFRLDLPNTFASHLKNLCRFFAGEFFVAVEPVA